jgi:hypothetical protein
MTAEILNNLHAEPQSSFMLRDILPGAGGRLTLGAMPLRIHGNRTVRGRGGRGTGRNGLQLGFQFEV